MSPAESLLPDRHCSLRSNHQPYQVSNRLVNLLSSHHIVHPLSQVAFLLSTRLHNLVFGPQISQQPNLPYIRPDILQRGLLVNPPDSRHSNLANNPLFFLVTNQLFFRRKIRLFNLALIQAVNPARNHLFNLHLIRALSLRRNRQFNQRRSHQRSQVDYLPINRYYRQRRSHLFILQCNRQRNLAPARLHNRALTRP